MYTDAKITNKIERTVIAQKAIGRLLEANMSMIEGRVKDLDGQKVTKVDGWWLKKIEPIIDSLKLEGIVPASKDIIGSNRHRVGLTKSYGRVSFEASYWVTFGKHEHTSDGAYYELSLPMGIIDDDNIFHVKEDWIKQSYTILFNAINMDYERIKKHRQMIEDHKTEISKLNSILPSYAYVR